MVKSDLLLQILHCFCSFYEKKNNKSHQKEDKATKLSVSMAKLEKNLPASILIFFTVDKWAGLQLTAHYWGTVVTHGRVPCSALWFGVTIDARDCREKVHSSSKSDGEGGGVIIAGWSENKRATRRRGRKELMRVAGIQNKNHLQQALNCDLRKMWTLNWNISSIRPSCRWNNMN